MQVEHVVESEQIWQLDMQAAQVLRLLGFSVQ